MSKVLELAISLTGKVNSSIRSSFGSINREVTTLDSKIAQMERSRGDVTRFRQLRTEVITTNREFNNAQQNLVRLSREIRNTSNPSRELEGELNRARRTVVNLNNRLTDQRTELGQVRDRLDQTGISTRNLSEEQARLERNIQSATRAQQRQVDAQQHYANSVQNLERASARTASARGKLFDAVAIGTTLALPVKLAIDAENTMADIKKVIDFDNEIELKNMEKSIMDITKNIPMTFNEIGEIIAAGGQAGIDKLDLSKFAVDSAKMGIAFDISAGDAGQMMAEWRSAFKMNQTEAGILADKINYLGNTTAASAPKISEVVTRIGPLGDVGGVASGEIAALGATLVGMGVGEEIAATGIKNLILTMNKGSAATKKQNAVYKSLGLNASDMAKKMQTDSKGAILELLSALKQVPEHARAAKLEQLVGKESIGAIAPLLGNIQELEKNFNKVDEAQRQFAGSMEAEFAARAATTENSIILLKNQMQNMGITLGTVVLPPIVELATKAGIVAAKVQEFADKYPNLTANIVKVTAAIMALTVVILGVNYAIALVRQGFAALKLAYSAVKLFLVEGKLLAIANTIATKALAAAQFIQAGAAKVAAGAQWLINKAMLAFPAIAITAAIVAVIAGIVWLVKNWDKAKESLNNLWAMFADKFPGMAAFAENAANVIKNTFGTAIEWVSGKVEWLGNAWEKTGGKLFKKNKTASSIEANLPAYAKGGIVTSPQIALIGEGRASEAIIPLEKTANSISLWEKAGSALGMDMSPKGIDIAAGSLDRNNSVINNASGSEKYEFNINVDARGATPGVEDDIKSKLIQELIPIILRILGEKDKDRLRLQFR